MRNWFYLLLIGVWNTKFWQILMIFQLLYINYTAWFNHPGLLNLGHLWPLFFVEWRINEVAQFLYIPPLRVHIVESTQIHGRTDSCWSSNRLKERVFTQTESLSEVSFSMHSRIKRAPCFKRLYYTPWNGRSAKVSCRVYHVLRMCRTFLRTSFCSKTSGLALKNGPMPLG